MSLICHYKFTVRHDTSDMVPVTITLFWDPRTHRYYNSQGVWVDSLGQLMPHSRPAGRFRSKGKWWATDRPLTLWWNQHYVSACFSDVLIIGWSDAAG